MFQLFFVLLFLLALSFTVLGFYVATVPLTGHSDSQFGEREDANSLAQAIVKREIELRTLTIALKARTITDKPSETELLKISNELEKTRMLCDRIDYVAKELKMEDIDTTSLRIQNQAARSLVEKWMVEIKKDQQVEKLLKQNGMMEKKNNILPRSSTRFAQEIAEMAEKITGNPKD